MLDLKKIDYKNFERQEQKEASYNDINQNISRTWEYLKNTHRLQSGECVCIRALATATNEWDQWCFPQELVLFNYDYDSYEEFKKFITQKVKGKRIYNFYYNTYNISIRKAKETCKENEGGFFGKGCNISSTSIIVVDLDNFSQSDYLKMKEDLKQRGLTGTIDIMSGHGYQIVFRLAENSKDEYLLLKFVKVLQENGYFPDCQCIDNARIFRLPNFWNQKPKKYDTVALSQVTDGEYSSRLFDVNEIFNAFGFDYDSFDLDKYYKKKKETRRANKKEISIEYNNNVNLYELYEDINIKELPVGIQNMMKGFKKGYTNFQTMILTIYFKRKGFTLEKIKDIIKKVESINGNSWNSWNVSDEVERFYNKYDYINKYTILDIECEFGDIDLSYNEQMYKIPMGVMKPTELKMYVYLLLNGNILKNDITEVFEISRPTMNKIIKECEYIICDNKFLTVKNDIEKNFIYVNKSFLNKILKLTSYQLSLYCYLFYRIGLKNEICTSIDSIKKYCLFSEKTITNTIKELEQLEYIKVKRSNFNSQKKSREQSNLYKIIK